MEKLLNELKKAKLSACRDWINCYFSKLSTSLLERVKRTIESWNEFAEEPIQLYDDRIEVVEIGVLTYRIKRDYRYFDDPDNYILAVVTGEDYPF